MINKDPRDYCFDCLDYDFRFLKEYFIGENKDKFDLVKFGETIYFYKKEST